jgi:hypothetical protein
MNLSMTEDFVARRRMQCGANGYTILTAASGRTVQQKSSELDLKNREKESIGQTTSRGKCFRQLVQSVDPEKVACCGVLQRENIVALNLDSFAWRRELGRC